ncbi:NADH:flavin oxidoreductase [Lentisphaerota bacterium ZTH]|nr:NADH:flavin oxidoreductase [Lentisphaerota bacterium]WET07175.1 NADH:flavin oxidoreductase [Lentisphaerota bacterium ZTH]
MNKLFSSASIGNCSIRNRIVRSATHSGMASADGYSTPELIEKLRELAINDVGLIIGGNTTVASEGRVADHMLAVDHDQLIPRLKLQTAAIQREGGRIFMQLGHSGAQLLLPDPGFGPSSFSIDGKRPYCREMTEAQIKYTINAFGKGAARAKAAGFDGVQLHGAHGYLLSEFLSPYYNKRTDKYGGSVENRSRMLLEAYGAVRTEVGEDYPVIVKINSSDFIEGGFSFADCLTVCRLLEKAGIDAVELSGGINAEGSKRKAAPRGDLKPEQEVYNREEAVIFKKEIGVPLILVGGIRSYDTAIKIIEDGMADFVSICRPLIREPDLIHRWHNGDYSRASCVSCNLCYIPVFSGKGLYCELDARIKSRQKTD